MLFIYLPASVFALIYYLYVNVHMCAYASVSTHMSVCVCVCLCLYLWLPEVPSRVICFEYQCLFWWRLFFSS